LPKLGVLARREQPRRLAARNPANRYCLACGQYRLEMHDGADANLRSSTEATGVKHSSASSDKDFVLDRSSHYMSIRSDEDPIADPAVVFCCGADNSIFHDDTAVADNNGTAFRHDSRAVHDAAACID